MFTWLENVLTSTESAMLHHLAPQGTQAASSATIVAGPDDAKRCLTVPAESNAGAEIARVVDSRLRSHPDFMEVCLPTACSTPRLVSYSAGMFYRPHVDAPTVTSAAIRSDLAGTIFVSDGADYDGGSLRVHLGDETVDLKGKQGSMVVYPAHLLHEVTEVISGQRTVVLVWIESLVADPSIRWMLAELRRAEQLAAQGDPDARAPIRTVYGQLHRLGHAQHSLMRE